MLGAAVPGAGGGVPVLIEIDGPALTGGYRQGSVFAEIYAYAFDTDGVVAAFFTKTIGLDLAKVGAALEADGGLRYVGRLELPPGEYTLRVLVRDPLRGTSRLEVQRLAVPAAAATPVLVGPFVTDSRAGWLRVHDGPPGLEADPFGLGTPGAVPMAAPVLAANGSAELVLFAAGMPAEPLRWRGEVTDATGAPVAGATVEPRDCVALAADRVRCTAELRSSGLPLGRYRLDVALSGDASGPLGSAGLDLPVR